MAGVHVCAFCEHMYNETNRKPLILLCGHTYCQQCLQNVVSGSSPACPSCGKNISTPLNDLVTNLAAIPVSSEKADSVASSKLLCNIHQHELHFWCSQCQVLSCRQCLVKTHVKHEFTTVEDIVLDDNYLLEMKTKMNANLREFRASFHTIQKFESLVKTIDEVKSLIPKMKKSLMTQELTLSNFFKLLETTSSESSFEHKQHVLNALGYKNQIKLEEDKINEVLKQIEDEVAHSQICNSPSRKKMKLTETERYMPDGCPWVITSNELAEKALHTMKETDHQTPKATVISTDESPILCLPEFLQYLATSSTTMELQLMDKAWKAPYTIDWLPLKAGGGKSADFNHCYRLKTLAKTLTYFQTLAASSTSVGDVNDATKNKVIILVYPATRTYDVCVLAFGKIVQSNTGSWPLPLEVHVIGMDRGNMEWVKCILPSLYRIAQPDMGECCVYLSKFDYEVDVMFPVFADLGKKFSTQHHLHLLSVLEDWKSDIEEAKKHNIAVEFMDF